MSSGEMRGTAITVGVIGIVLMGVGLGIFLLADNGSTNPGAGVLIRSGALLSAVALVLPSVRKPSYTTILVAGAGLILILARPGLLWVALIGWVLWIVSGRQRRTSDNDS